MNTFVSMQEAFKQLSTMTTGMVIDVNGRPMEVVRMGRCTTFRSMSIQPEAIRRPDDGRQFSKVHMSDHKIAQAIVVG